MMDKESLTPLLGSVLPLLIGCIFLFLYLVHQRKKSRITKTGVAVEGVVFELKSKSSAANDGNLQFPIIRFVTLKGEWITEQYNVSSFLVKPGKKVAVWYNAENPKEFIVDMGRPSNLVMPLLLIVGLALITYGVYNLYFLKT